MRDETKFAKLAIIAGLLFHLLACTASPPERIHLGTKPFQFDPKQVSDLMITRFDPNSGDRWIASFKQSSKEWEITSAPDDQPVSDRKANETFILHLLDSFQTLEIQAAAPHGPLESFQLDPPRFAVRWKTPKQEFELQVGSTSQNPSGNYFTVDKKQVWIARGSALAMLNLIDSFQFLRKRTWTTLAPDDVDEIEVQPPGKPLLYAQREGDQWTRKNHTVIKKHLESLLNDLATSETLEIIDRSTQVEEVRSFFKPGSFYLTRLLDRKGKATALKLLKKNNRIYGLNSDRPNVAFILKPKLLDELQDYSSQ